jgi:hypothetical protein
LWLKDCWTSPSGVLLSCNKALIMLLVHCLSINFSQLKIYNHQVQRVSLKFICIFSVGYWITYYSLIKKTFPFCLLTVEITTYLVKTLKRNYIFPESLMFVFDSHCSSLLLQVWQNFSCCKFLWLWHSTWEIHVRMWGVIE